MTILSKSRIEEAETNFFRAEFLGSGFLPINKSDLQNLAMPILLLTGERSPKIWQYLVDELHSLIPSSQKEVILDASHIMHEDNPAQFNSAVLSFLRNVTPHNT